MDQAKKLAREWIEVWDRGDPSTLPLADGFVHVSPFGRIEGREKYLEVVRPMAEANVASLHIQDVIGEGDRACITFSMDTPNGPVACCDWVVVADGEIASVDSYYDSRNLSHFEKY
ncbi:MAG: nuclear transport factor 2 family protein [Thermoanaerobaculia bacterium]